MVEALASLAGVVVGFLLKTAVDWRTERRRTEREDRLRFAQEKQRAYVEMSVQLARMTRLWGPTEQAEAARDRLEAELDRLRAEHPGVAVTDRVLGTVPQDLEAARLKAEELNDRLVEQFEELEQGFHVLLLLGSRAVRDAAQTAMAALPTAGGLDSAALKTATADFVIAAGRDLGRPPREDRRD